MKPFQLIFTYARKYKFALTVTAINMLLLVGAQLLIPWIVKLLVEAALLSLNWKLTFSTIPIPLPAVHHLGCGFLCASFQICTAEYRHMPGDPISDRKARLRWR